jgi:hypothetical protein
LLLLLQALEQLRPFRPDLIIAVGGGSPMDAAKLMWLMYEQPGTKFEEVAARFMVRLLLLLTWLRIASVCLMVRTLLLVSVCALLLPVWCSLAVFLPACFCIVPHCRVPFFKLSAAVHLLRCLQDIRKRINSIPPLGKVAQFVAIPTTSGTGSEVTPFAVVTDEHTGIKYPLADYALVRNLEAAAVVMFVCVLLLLW